IWQSITIEEPMNPMAPMPMLLPSSLSSSSSAAISGSGLRDPTTRKQDACLPSTMLVSFEPPSPTPTIAGWQAPGRMHAVGARRPLDGGARGGAPQGGLQRDRPALDPRLVADLDVPARQAGVAAHGAAVLLGRVVILEHRLDDERG